jgi:ubiquinone/menaquinone biosynthesis C-methylase UbiE
MPFSDWLLYQVARRWPSPTAQQTEKFGADPGTDAYEMAYAQHQFDRKVRSGMMISVFGLDVLEIGCGHGGITCYLAAVGARSVYGIDLNTRHLQYARAFTRQVAEQLGRREFPVHYSEMSATELAFPDESFDVVMADNVFEHFTEPEAVMQEALRVLRPGGRLLVPIFSERTVVRALQRAIRDQPALLKVYPGVMNNPQRVRDVRPYKDLNDMTFGKFRAMAERSGFKVENFQPVANRPGRIVQRIPGLRSTRLMDVCSYGGSAILRKPKATPAFAS